LGGGCGGEGEHNETGQPASDLRDVGNGCPQTS
jgi:hypothetical protein